MKHQFYVDSPQQQRVTKARFVISGWFFDKNGNKAKTIRIKFGSQTVLSSRTERRDVCAHFSEIQIPDPEIGFYADCKPGCGYWRISVEAETSEGEVIKIFYRRLVVLPDIRRGAITIFPPQLAGTPWAKGIECFITQEMKKQLLSIAPTAEGKAITVVIPIYNAAEHLRKCLESLAAYLHPHHVVLLVDDCSTDPQIAVLAETFVKNRPGAVYITNPKNLGFVGSCNRAVLELDTSGNDVLLLNSDTEITFGAIEELQAVMNLHDRYFAVCPRSNRATIYSYPRSSPQDAADSHALWLEDHRLLPRWQLMPTPVGFCVLLRRSVINLIGLFDPIYGRGYNEENDLACRANRLGYSSIAANHCFVFHHEGKSFGAERSILEEQNRKILLDRYPEYGRTNTFWVDHQTHPVERFSDLKLRKQKHILFDISQLQNAHNGTSIFCTQLLRGLLPALRDQVKVTVYVNSTAFKFHESSFEGYRDIKFDAPRENETYDLVFIPLQLWHNDQILAAFRMAPRVAFTLYDVISLRCNYLFDAPRWSALGTAAELSDEVVTISDYSAKDARFFFPSMAPTKTLYNSTDPLWRRAENVGGHILVVGNPYSHKAIAEALIMLKGANLDLKVIGARKSDDAGSNEQRLKSGNLNAATVEQLYNDAAVVVFPSVYEGFGYPALEASYRGKPVVLHDNPLNRELVANGHVSYPFFFKRFSELPELVNAAKELVCSANTPTPGKSLLESGEICAAIILEMLSREVDSKKLIRRWQWVQTVASSQLT